MSHDSDMAKEFRAMKAEKKERRAMEQKAKEQRKPVRFDIPPNAQPSPCRGCGALIVWIVTKNDKRMPVDSDGTSHFATCPKASNFRNPKETK